MSALELTDVRKVYQSGDSEVVAAHVAKKSPFLVRAADGCANTIDDDGSLHGSAPLCPLPAADSRQAPGAVTCY